MYFFSFRFMSSLKCEIDLKCLRGYRRRFIWGNDLILVILSGTMLAERGSDDEMIHTHILLPILQLISSSPTTWGHDVKMHRYPMLDWEKTFSSIVEHNIPARQLLVTPLCWLTGSICSHSGVWKESSFQLLCLFLVSTVNPFAWCQFFKTLTFGLHHQC